MTEKVAPPPMVAQPVADPTQVWPNVPPTDGAIYGFVDPAHGSHMIAMSVSTWQKIMADMKVLKDRLDKLSAENIEYKQGRNPADDGGRIITLDKLNRRH